MRIVRNGAWTRMRMIRIQGWMRIVRNGGWMRIILIGARMRIVRIQGRRGRRFHGALYSGPAVLQASRTAAQPYLFPWALDCSPAVLQPMSTAAQPYPMEPTGQARNRAGSSVASLD